MSDAKFIPMKGASLRSDYIHFDVTPFISTKVFKKWLSKKGYGR